MIRKLSLLLPFLTTALMAQENAIHLTVLAYQWTTTHKTVTFSWPGHSNSSCNGSFNMNAYAAGSSVYANGSTSSSCTTTFTPSSNQNIDIQKPVVFIVADSDTSRMVLSCTRNVRWSQCRALTPGEFVARMESGHFEVKAFEKGKEEWVRFEILQQTALTRAAPAPETVQSATSSIEAPGVAPANTSTELPKRWKSMESGTIRVLRFEGEYIYAEQMFPEAASKAGIFFLWELKKDGDKYVGNVNGRVVNQGVGTSCPIKFPAEFTLVTRGRIEGRSLVPPPDATLDWKTCQYTKASLWQDFSWIPVR